MGDLSPAAKTARAPWNDYGEIYFCDSYEEMLDLANEMASERLEGKRRSMA